MTAAQARQPNLIGAMQSRISLTGDSSPVATQWGAGSDAAAANLCRRSTRRHRTSNHGYDPRQCASRRDRYSSQMTIGIDRLIVLTGVPVLSVSARRLTYFEQTRGKQFMRSYSVLCACLLAFGVAFGTASTAAHAAAIGSAVPALLAGEMSPANNLVEPVHYRRRWHCHTRWRRRCGFRIRRVCTRWNRRGWCKRWRARRVWACWRAPVRYCHRR